MTMYGVPLRGQIQFDVTVENQELHISLPDRTQVIVWLSSKRCDTGHEVHQQDKNSSKPLVPGQDIGKRADRNSREHCDQAHRNPSPPYCNVHCEQDGRRNHCRKFEDLPTFYKLVKKVPTCLKMVTYKDRRVMRHQLLKSDVPKKIGPRQFPRRQAAFQVI
jgi:hypothetical protein